MTCIFEEGGAQHLIRTVSPNTPTPIPSQPFPFLELPREIRDSIYHYALLRPRAGPSVNHTHICYFNRKVPAEAAYKSYWTPYWGTKESTRLFLVNHQISHESLELFYSTYPFHFVQTVDVTFVNATLRDTLSPWTRSLITKIGFMFGMFSAPMPVTLRNEEKTRQVFEAVVKLLPNVKRVTLSLSFSGYDVPEFQVKEVVARALNVASPLTSFAHISLEGATYEESAQRTRLMREVREALGCD